MKSKLGQNFLKNKSKLEKIAVSLDIKEGDVVVEIGPGHGELTGELRIKNHELRIIAIEKDKKLAAELKRKFRGDKNMEVIEGDVLEILPFMVYDSSFMLHNYKIIGNIPYYITGYLLRVFEEIENKPELIVLTIQKEVAERIIAKPSKMNLLAASVQFWADAEILDYISKKDFDPVPEVDSAVIKLTTYNQQPTTEKKKNYYKFVKALFKQPRKTILNNLRLITDDQQLLTEKLKEAGVNPSDRPQNLSLKQIIELSEIF